MNNIELVIEHAERVGELSVSKIDKARSDLSALRARAARIDEFEREMNTAVDILRALDKYGVALPDEAHELIAAHPAAKVKA